jgi:hypothetical protein
VVVRGLGGGGQWKFVYRRLKTSFGGHTNGSVRFMALHFHRNYISVIPAFGFRRQCRVSRCHSHLYCGQIYLMKKKKGGMGGFLNLIESTKHSCE